MSLDTLRGRARGRRVIMVVAMDERRAIGRNGDMPWHLPADLQHFKALTLGGAVVMGRRTYQSIGRPLPRRHNVVVTRDREFAAPGCEVVHSLDEALERSGSAPVFIIGGGEIYAQSLALADALMITRVHTTVDDADTWFPEVDPAAWNLVAAIERDADAKNPFAMSFELQERHSG